MNFSCLSTGVDLASTWQWIRIFTAATDSRKCRSGLAAEACAWLQATISQTAVSETKSPSHDSMIPRVGLRRWGAPISLGLAS
eukprot:s522_g5.t1